MATRTGKVSLTKRQLEATIAGLTALLAGEWGEGDSTDIECSHADAEAALDRLTAALGAKETVE